MDFILSIDKGAVINRLFVIVYNNVYISRRFVYNLFINQNMKNS